MLKQDKRRHVIYPMKSSFKTRLQDEEGLSSVVNSQLQPMCSTHSCSTSGRRKLQVRTTNGIQLPIVNVEPSCGQYIRSMASISGFDSVFKVYVSLKALLGSVCEWHVVVTETRQAIYLSI